MSRIPRKEAPWRLVLSKALFTRDKIQRKSRSNMALAKASVAKSACQTAAHRKRGIRRGGGARFEGGTFWRGVCGATCLLFGLGLLHHLSAHFDSGGEDGAGEVCDVDSLQVTHLLGSYRKDSFFLLYFFVLLKKLNSMLGNLVTIRRKQTQI